DFAETRHFGFGEIPNTGGRLDSDLLENLRALGRTNSIDVGQTDVDRLVAWYVYAGDTSHSYPSPVLIRLALALLVLGINANNADHSAPLDDLATLTATLDRRRNLHVSSRSLTSRPLRAARYSSRCLLCPKTVGDSATRQVVG